VSKERTLAEIVAEVEADSGVTAAGLAIVEAWIAYRGKSHSQREAE
jgi:hypothetical protein